MTAGNRHLLLSLVDMRRWEWRSAVVLGSLAAWLRLRLHHDAGLDGAGVG